jgi:cbb3-type cytochrome oxidase cytochrome c subunit
VKIRADRHVGLLLAGIVLLAFVAIGATIALPASDASIEAEPRKLSKDTARGMHVFKSEGCWYCHTQYVRSTAVDKDLGAQLKPSAYAGLSPSMLGVERVGPDLTYPEQTEEAALAAAIREHGGAGSFGYLSRADLEAIAAYLLSRE